MNLGDIMKPRIIQRALLASAMGDVLVVATDGAGIEMEISENSRYAGDIGLCGKLPDGLHLFTGWATIEKETHESIWATEVVWHGETRPVFPEEMAELFAMRPPTIDLDDGPDDADRSS